MASSCIGRLAGQVHSPGACSSSRVVNHATWLAPCGHGAIAASRRSLGINHRQPGADGVILQAGLPQGLIRQPVAARLRAGPASISVAGVEGTLQPPPDSTGDDGDVLAVDMRAVSVTSMQLSAAVRVRAPASVVWGLLTDYQHLDRYVPSLVENQCLERRLDGAVLYQVGAQELALGMRFSARCKLEVTEHRDGLVPEACAPAEGATKEQLSGLLPWPACTLPGVPCSDISFELVEGDFQVFKGIWRIQPGREDPSTCTLIYSLYVKPHPWLPVRLIKGRISSDMVTNLRALSTAAARVHSGDSDDVTDGVGEGGMAAGPVM